MTVHEKVIKTLEPFGIPVRPDFSDDEKEEYFTFDIIDDRAILFADNEPASVISYLQIHYAAPVDKNYLKLKKQVRKALAQAGFSYPTVTDTTVKGDPVRHLVFECSTENEYELED